MSDTDKMTALVQLSGAVAHELNNIFTAVIGNLSLLDEQLVQGSEPAQVIGEVVRTAQRGIALSAKLQTFAGRQPLKRKHIDVNRAVIDIVRKVRPRLPADIELILISMPHPGVSFVDEDKLRDTIDELIKNAVTAMNGRGRLSVAIVSRKFSHEDEAGLKPGAYIGIHVTDTGEGMDPLVAARALDPMFSTKATHINAGWGLSNCSGFVRQSGGTMKIKSQLGHGTSVEIYLPVSLEGQPATAG
jgi:C4-dicarboxylate-specific signal transduction histidine kinase